MSTRSFIGIRNDNGTITGIYCHFDGYPSGTGKILLENYQDVRKILQLINLGDISSIGINVEPPLSKKLDREDAAWTYVHSYARDWGEDYGPIAPRNFTDVNDVVRNSWYDYIYVWETPLKEWWIGNVGCLQPSIVQVGDYSWEDTGIPLIKGVVRYEKLTSERVAGDD